MSLTYLGLPVSLDSEFAKRDIQKPQNDILNIYDVDGGVTLDTINLYGNTTILGNFKPVTGLPTSFTRTYPLLKISTDEVFNANNVSNSAVAIPAIIDIPFWNPLRGDGKGFSIDLGYNPVRLKVFQDTNNAATNRFTISTNALSAAPTTVSAKTGTDDIGTIISGFSSGSTGEAKGRSILADKSFTATSLGVWLESSEGNSQMAIYSSTGTYLGKTEIKANVGIGRHLFALESPVEIVSGQRYVVIINTSVNERIKKFAQSTNFQLVVTKSTPFNTSNITVSTFTSTSTYCMFIDGFQTVTNSSAVENNSFNIWANGMVSIGQTLNTATYANQGSAGDQELNPMSLLVQNDIAIGTDGLKTSSLGRLHIKQTSAEYTANRFIAYFASGDGVNAGAISKDGEYIVSKPGGGLICFDAANGQLYRVSVSNGALQVNLYT